MTPEMRAGEHGGVDFEVPDEERVTTPHTTSPVEVPSSQPEGEIQPSDEPSGNTPEVANPGDILGTPKVAAGPDEGTPIRPEAGLTPETTPTRPAISPVKKIRAGIVDIESKVDEIARHRAEERLQAELRGEFADQTNRHHWWERVGDKTRDVFRKTARHWGEEGYRQRYIAQERRRIFTELQGTQPNAFAPEERTHETFNAESRAIIDRFLSEYELVQTRQGEHREELTDATITSALQEIVANYANGDINEQIFNEQKQGLLDTLRTNRPDLFAHERSTVDNLLEVAQDLRAVRDHSQRIAATDLDIDFQLGHARSAIQDESHLRSFERLVKHVQRNPVLGKIISPATLGFATSLAVRPAMSLLRAGAKVANIASPIAGAVVGGGYAGLRRSGELKGDVTHVRRATAMGYEIPRGARRLEHMREYVYNQADVGTLTEGLTRNLEALRNAELLPADREAQLQGALDAIANAEARMDTGFAMKHDFLRFTDPTQIERGRLDLLRTIAEAKVRIHEVAGAAPDPAAERQRIDQRLEELRRARTTELGADVANIDQRFRRFKNVEVAKAVAYGAATGLAAGALGQWAVGEFREHVLHQQNVPQSSLEHLWGKITGHRDMVGTGHFDNPPLHLEQVGAHGQINLGEGYHIVPSPDHPGLVNIVDTQGHQLTSPFTVDQTTGKIPEEVRATLMHQG